MGVGSNPTSDSFVLFLHSINKYNIRGFIFYLLTTTHSFGIWWLSTMFEIQILGDSWKFLVSPIGHKQAIFCNFFWETYLTSIVESVNSVRHRFTPSTVLFYAKSNMPKIGRSSVILRSSGIHCSYAAATQFFKQIDRCKSLLSLPRWYWASIGMTKTKRRKGNRRKCMKRYQLFLEYEFWLFLRQILRQPFFEQEEIRRRKKDEEEAVRHRSVA